MNRIKRTVRFTPRNYEMIQSIADGIFLNEKRNEGDFSKSLNWILDCFRLETEYSALVNFMLHKARYERGNRSTETIEKMRQFQALLKRISDGTENSQEEVIYDNDHI